MHGHFDRSACHFQFVTGIRREWNGGDNFRK